MNDGETKAASLRKRAVERLKEAIELLGRNPDAFVSNGQHDAG